MSGGLYAGPACPLCGALLEGWQMVPGEQICPHCLRSYLSTPFTPPEPPRPRVESLALAGPAGGVPCARHAGNAAVASCARCGVFMCALCRIEIDGQELCPGCFDRLSSEGVLSSARNRLRDYQGLSLSLAVLGFLLCPLGLLTGPATFYTIYRAVQQRRRWNEGGRPFPLWIAGLLAVLQMAGGVFMIWSMIH